MLLLYQVRDQRDTGTSTDDEIFYGALQHELQPKGEYYDRRAEGARQLLAGTRPRGRDLGGTTPPTT